VGAVGRQRWREEKEKASAEERISGMSLHVNKEKRKKGADEKLICYSRITKKKGRKVRAWACYYPSKSLSPNMGRCQNKKGESCRVNGDSGFQGEIETGTCFGGT